MKILLVTRSQKKCEELKQEIGEIGNEMLFSVGRNTAESRLKANPDIGAVVIEPPVLGDVPELISVIRKSPATLPVIPVIVLDQDPTGGAGASVQFVPPDDPEAMDAMRAALSSL